MLQQPPVSQSHLGTGTGLLAFSRGGKFHSTVYFSTPKSEFIALNVSIFSCFLTSLDTAYMSFSPTCPSNLLNLTAFPIRIMHLVSLYLNNSLGRHNNFLTAWGGRRLLLVLRALGNRHLPAGFFLIRNSCTRYKPHCFVMLMHYTSLFRDAFPSRTGELRKQILSLSFYIVHLYKFNLKSKDPSELSYHIIAVLWAYAQSWKAYRESHFSHFTFTKCFLPACTTFCQKHGNCVSDAPLRCILPPKSAVRHGDCYCPINCYAQQWKQS